MKIRQLNNSEYDNAIALSLSVFAECGTADFDIKGLETFKRFIHNKELMNELTIFGAFDDDRLIGIIGTKTMAHISLCFLYTRNFTVDVLAENYLMLPMLIKRK